MSDEKTLEQLIDTALLKDRFRLTRRLIQLRRQGKASPEVALFQKWNDDLTRSIDARSQREAEVPRPRFDHDLPILEHRDELIEILKRQQVAIVAGETGSGKSTQLPQLALAAGFGVRAMIAHTQPRRIAARSIAARVADELQVPLGKQVGFKVRFADRTDPGTYIKFLTDGMLLAETQTDRFLEQYDLVILDEAHERSLNIDFLLGFLIPLLDRRPELHLVVTSATIDAERFATHLSTRDRTVPVIEVSGRTYPVEIRYRPIESERDDDEADQAEAITRAIHEVAAIDRGDILVFLPTEREIRDTAQRLRREQLPGDGARTTEILPLYARLSSSEQNRIFQTSDYRRIVLATNVAESSLTVPNIRYVIDVGNARISRYSPRSKVQRLPIESISRASADQRAGRCGRIAPGICIRLYSEEDYQRRDEFTTPEIRRTNLSSVILQAKVLKLGDVDQIPFLDPPRPDSVRDGYKTLFEIGAVDDRRELTSRGRQIASMPVDPRIARMIIAGTEEHCVEEVLVIAAALELQDPRDRPYEKQQQADQRHEQFLDDDSDFLSYLKIWEFYHHLRETVSRSQLRKACQQNFLSYNRLREWNEIHRQLLSIVPQAHGQLRHSVADFKRHADLYRGLHRSLLTGLLSGVALKTGDVEYTGPGGIKLHLWPGSGLYRSRPTWIVAAEFVETTRQYARVAARISPVWLESLADHLVKRSYSDPRWYRKRRTVMAKEKVSLFGLPVVTERPVRYGPIDPVASRKVFIQEALVDQRLDANLDFVTHNRRTRSELNELADRTRRRDFLLDDYSIYRFYDQRIPAVVFDLASLQHWMKRASDDEVASLSMKPEDLADMSGLDRMTQSFPDTWEDGPLRLPIEYAFNTGSERDGVTLQVPVEALNQISLDRLEWLVPGMLEEKITALIRTLPKSLRRNFVPIPDTARALVDSMAFGEGNLLAVLADRLGRLAGERISVSQFDLEKLDAHLKVNLQVLEADGKLGPVGRDLSRLRTDVSQIKANVSEQAGPSEWSQAGLTDWSFGELPESVTVQRQGVAMLAYPSLVDDGESVSLVLQPSLARAQHVSRRGILRLYAIQHRKSLRSQVRWLPQWEETCLWAASRVDASMLKNMVQDLIAVRAVLGTEVMLRSEAEFRARSQDAPQRIALATQDVAPLIPRIFANFHSARLALENLNHSRWQLIRNDIESQLARLFSGQFLVETPWIWLLEWPRYLSAIAYRSEKARSTAEAVEQMRLVQHFEALAWNQWERNENLGLFDPELVTFRWMIEELRVSFFAQSLGTSIKISPQRMEKQWAKVTQS